VGWPGQGWRSTGAEVEASRSAARIGPADLGAVGAKPRSDRDQDADQLKLPFYLWTRAGVATLIEREYGMAVSLTTVGRYLRAWGMTPQKPVRRAYERNDSAIKRWLVEEYSALAADAKRERATIYRADEMGLRSDNVTGTSYAPVGQTPVVRATGQRFGCNMISAIEAPWRSWCFRASFITRCSSNS